MTGRHRVLIVDDHPVVRRGLRTMLDGEAWVEGVVEAATVAEALRQAVTQDVHVVAMDVMLPDGDGIDATQQILRLKPGVQVLVFTMSDDDDLVAQALRAGARGYVLKSTDPDVIIDALCAVAAGGVVLGPSIGPAVLATLQHAPAELPPPFDQLTPRQRDILTALVGGNSNARIARHLGITEKTVRNQLTPIFTLLGVGDRVQAALLARDAGITARPHPQP